MLVTSSQSSTQRPLGLSVEELYSLDRQYRRIEDQQQQRLASSNLNRGASRSLDLPSLPSLEVHGHNYSHRSNKPPAPILNYPRSHSIDQLRYIPPPPVLKHTYPQRSKTTDVGQRNYTQQSIVTTGNSFMYDLPSSSMDYSDNRNICKLRRQQPLKRESSRRIVVRPIVHRRREPSLNSSCESLDERGSSVPFTPSASLIEDVIDDLANETKKLTHEQSNNDSFSDDGEINLYELRVAIGKTYDTSDISVQLEGPKILIHCHTIEPTDRRGNYRKHEYKSELIVPDIVNDESIVAYLTEDGELIVEGKYHLWAWKEIKKQRRIEQEELTSPKTDRGDLVQERLTSRSSDSKTNLFDGQYFFTNDSPPQLIYYLHLPFQSLMDEIRIQSNSELSYLKISIDHSKSRLCYLPRNYQYDYTRLHIQFLPQNFIRIQLPTFN